MGGGHGFFTGPSSVQANAQAGLPFAEVPEELRSRIADVLRNEPEHPQPTVRFSHRDWDRRPFGLRTFLTPHAGGLLVALLLVLAEVGLPTSDHSSRRSASTAASWPETGACCSPLPLPTSVP